MPSTTPTLNDIIVRAGAGAGKTTDLVNRVIGIEAQFLAGHQRHAKIAVTTFTRKATQELKERLMAKAVASTDEQLIEFVQKSSQLHISTIHGILSMYLSRYGSAIGLTPQFKILSQRAILRRTKKVFREMLQAIPEFSQKASKLLEVTDLKNLLSAILQYEVISTLGKPRRIRRSDLESLVEDKLLQVREDGEALLSLLAAQDLPDSWQTYQRELSLLIRREQLLASDIQEFLEQVKSPTKSKKIADELGDAKNGFQEFLKDFNSYNMTSEFFDNHERLSQDFEFCAEKCVESLALKKLTSGQLSLADLELLSWKLCQEYPETARLFSEEWDYWMVDEYQDTSPLQVNLLKFLMGERKSFIVGDPQQSIYLFRGARSEVFIEKEKFVSQSGGECLTLMKNYRSQGPVVLFINKLFTGLNKKQFQSMEIGFNKDLVTPEAEAIQILHTSDSDQEISATLFRILELIGQGVRPEKICVLSRGNKELDLLAKEAQKISLPVQVHAASQFSGRQEIRDAVSLLKFLVNPSDNLSFLQLLRSPHHFVPDEKLQLLGSLTSESYFGKALIHGWEPVLALQRALMECQDRGLVAVWKESLRKFHYFDYLFAQDPGGRKEANLVKLVSLVSSAEKTPGFSILDFIDEIATPQVESDGDQDATPVVEPSKVNLMTIHASKGLQFEYVIIPFLGKRAPTPVAQFWLTDDDGAWTLSLPNLEDNRLTRSLFGEMVLENRKAREALELERLLYVAVTRAELGVTLLWSSEESGSLSSRLVQLGFGAASADSEALDRIENHDGFSVRIRGLQELHAISSISEQIIPASKDEHRTVRAPWSQLGPTVASSIAVTEILSPAGANAPTDRAVTSEQSLASLKKAQLGVEVHRLFENLKYGVEPSDQSKMIKDAVKFLSTYGSGQILEIIKNGEVEWGFAVQKNKSLIQGQIDLWGRDNAGTFFVVDYKTGSERYQEKALEQLEIYAWALRRMGKIPQDVRPDLLIVYPLSEKVMRRAASKFTAIDALLEEL